MFSRILIISLSLFSLRLHADQGRPVDRPPQFVMLAFDGSKSIPMWEETRAFAKEERLNFTYFLSGVYFLTEANKGKYHGPLHNPGVSDIGFGGTSGDLSSRIDEVNLASAEGNEMGSHANGHFDGSKFSQTDWASEFAQFNNLIFGVFTNNGLGSTNSGLHLSVADIVGFRAPLLGVSAGLWPDLGQGKFRYDTSRTSAPTAWPTKINGIWNFPLATLHIAGTTKRTLSMDYNFYVADSGAKPDEANAALYEQRMFETYMAYFQANYNGNRAPVHIGHHFSKWNGGAYWNAMKRFAKEVCSQPEVRCVTYHELADYMDKQHSVELARYEAGAFAPTPQPFFFKSELRKFAGRVVPGVNRDFAPDTGEALSFDPPEAHDE